MPEDQTDPELEKDFEDDGVEGVDPALEEFVLPDDGHIILDHDDLQEDAS